MRFRTSTLDLSAVLLPAKARLVAIAGNPHSQSSFIKMISSRCYSCKECWEGRFTGLTATRADDIIFGGWWDGRFTLPCRSSRLPKSRKRDRFIAWMDKYRLRQKLEASRELASFAETQTD